VKAFYILKNVKKVLNEKWESEYTDELFRAILSVENLNEAKSFFRDLLTESELIDFGNRWKAARMLAKKIPYKKIEEATGFSSTTVARVAKWVKKGRGGYRLALKRIE
jgi:TrpR-related protein YerC/YecD